MKNELVYSTSEAKNCPKLTRRNQILWPALIIFAAVFTLVVAYFLRDYPTYIGLIVFEYIVVGSLTICGVWLIIAAFKNTLNKMLWIIPIIFLSCNHLEKGTVLKKEYEPTHSYVALQPVIIGKTTTLIPYVVTDYEDFILTIEGEYKGEIIHEHVYVTRECFNSLKQGDIWNLSDNCTFSDDNNLKEPK